MDGWEELLFELSDIEGHGIIGAAVTGGDVILVTCPDECDVIMDSEKD